jgi:hypothetical protein
VPAASVNPNPVRSRSFPIPSRFCAKVKAR